MHISSTFLLAFSTTYVSAAHPSHCASSTPAASTSSSAATLGYDGPGSYIPSTITGNNLTFGQHYAVLNLDLLNAPIGVIGDTVAGRAFINNTASWINIVHAQKPPPLNIFTRVYFANSRKPEIKPNGPFFEAAVAFTTANSSETQIYSGFNVDTAAGDVVLQKTGYYAGTGNALENILDAQSIDTVILSGLTTSGAVLSTTYRLFDLGYKV